jgi:hypothetical protein
MSTINVTDVNEAPNAGTDFSASAAGIRGRCCVVLADVNATDPDDQGGGGTTQPYDFENLKYSITGGNGAGLFEIDRRHGSSISPGLGAASQLGTSMRADNQHVADRQRPAGTRNGPRRF